MPNRKTGYDAMLKDVVATLKNSPQELSHVVEQSTKVIAAANDLTKDELALISAYVKSDLKAFADSYEESKSGPFYLTLANSIWQGLLDITDRTKVEWMELAADLEHQGLYQTGDMIGLGILVCEQCGHKTQYSHPTEITACSECGNHHFSRLPLKP